MKSWKEREGKGGKRNADPCHTQAPTPLQECEHYSPHTRPNTNKKGSLTVIFSSKHKKRRKAALVLLFFPPGFCLSKYSCPYTALQTCHDFQNTFGGGKE